MTTTLAALLDGPLGSTLIPRVLPDAPLEITQVTLVEDLAQTDALRPGAIAVLSRTCLVSASGYQLDVLVRQAAERDVSALVLRSATRRSVTAESLARRGRLAIVEVADDADPLQVTDWLGAAVSGDSRAALARLAAAASYEPDEHADATTVLRELATLSGVPLMRTDWDEVGAPVEVDGRRIGAVVTSELGPTATIAARIAAATLAQLLTARERETLRPVLSTSSALSHLLLCAQTNLAAVSERALDVGLHVHGWHCAVRLVVDNSGSDDDVLALIEGDLVALIARRGRENRSSWTVARPDSTLVLVRTTQSNPGRGSDRLVRHAVDEILADLIARHPSAHFRVGVATPHEGAFGLRASAEEARIALASAQLSDESVSIATFDALGLRRMLAEWLVTDTARDTVTDLLAPLDALGPEKAAIAIETLHAYLDERGSLQRAAARLHVHRNAVVYRMAQIGGTLPNDLTNPNERFALQLACRARLMTLGKA